MESQTDTLQPRRDVRGDNMCLSPLLEGSRQTPLPGPSHPLSPPATRAIQFRWPILAHVDTDEPVWSEVREP